MAARRLYAEIVGVLGNGPIVPSALGQLHYTRRVLNEALRLPSVLLFTRRANTDTELGGLAIPAGAEIAYSPYALHRDPACYPDPGRFDPDRWLATPSLPFNPFGAGRHKCVGDVFAWTEMTIVLAAIARRWQLRPAPDHVVREALAEVPRPNALPMIVKPVPD